MKKAISILLTLALLCALLPAGVVQAAEDRPYPAVSENRNSQDYFTWASTVNSYLFENASGGLTRVEYTPPRVSVQDTEQGEQKITEWEAGIVVEDYTPEFTLQASHKVDFELERWGGFFAGETYNFFIFGQDNPEEDDEKEIIRVVKYSKDWKRLGAASLCGADTSLPTIIPFADGSLRCAEYGGMLYIRTSHKIYEMDGLNHQHSLSITVREDDMTVTDSPYDLGSVSHSFNQFLIVGSDRQIVSVDQGDAHPRSIVLIIWPALAGDEPFADWGRAYTIRSFPGETGQNYTGASVGGLAETENGYVVAYSFDRDDGARGARNVYLAYLDKETEAVTTTTVSTSDADTPVLAPTGLDGGYLLWTDADRHDTLSYARYSADGTVGEVRTAKGGLSDCQPIVYQNKVVWYVTDDSVPVFYVLDEDGLSVIPSAYALRVASAQGGKVTASQEWAAAGTKITLTVTPNPGFVAQAPRVTDAAGAPVALTREGDVYTFTMPGSDVTVTPNFLSEIYSITVLPAQGGSATADPEHAAVGTKVWLTLKADDGYRLAGLTVRGDDGVVYETRTYGEDEGDMVYVEHAFTMPACNVTVTVDIVKVAPDTPDTPDIPDTPDTPDTPDDPTPSKPQFTDVPADMWYAEPVSWAVEKGITNGMTDTLFKPDNNCTRAQIVTFLWRANGSPEPTSTDNPFVDVPESQYYYKAVLWAVEKNITTGVDATHFKPDNVCKRGQAVTFLWRAAGEPAPTSSANPFVDVPKGQFYHDAVLWAVEKNITTGTTATTFKPDNICTRGHIVTFLYRALAE